MAAQKTNTQKPLAISEMELTPFPLGPNKFICPNFSGFAIGTVDNGVLLPKRFSTSLYQLAALIYTLYKTYPDIKKKENVDEFVDPPSKVEGADWATKVTAGNYDGAYIVHLRLYRFFRNDRRWQPTTRGCVLSVEELDATIEILEDVYMVRLICLFYVCFLHN